MTRNFEATGKRIGRMTDKKNEAYGDSFTRSGRILQVLYPNGIPTNSYVYALGMLRIVDKLFRIATNPTAFDEDPWQDIAGYALLMVGREDPCETFGSVEGDPDGLHGFLPTVDSTSPAIQKEGYEPLPSSETHNEDSA